MKDVMAYRDSVRVDIYTIELLKMAINTLYPDMTVDPGIKDPVVVWWTGFTGETGRTKQCGPHQCFFTINKGYMNHTQTKAFLFYGSDLRYTDLPLPRQPHHQWGLLHEESPKNNYLLTHPELLTLFNHSSTFSRHADVPLTLLYLDRLTDLESKKYLVPTQQKTRLLNQGEVALVSYTQSDCGVPSDRDHFVRMLLTQVKVDSYGTCEHNKDLPSHLRDPLTGMFHDDLYKTLAQYKFTVTFENAVCNDYVTEKFWRPFIVGSVPIVFGSPKIKDLLPSPHSAILVSDYDNITALVNHLNFLNENDEEYEKYLNFKHDGIQNNDLKQLFHKQKSDESHKSNMADRLECLVCTRIHENLQRVGLGMEPNLHHVTAGHHDCPPPQRFSDSPKGSLELVDDDRWAKDWIKAGYLAKALRLYLDRGGNLTAEQVKAKAYEIQVRDRGLYWV